MAAGYVYCAVEGTWCPLPELYLKKFTEIPACGKAETGASWDCNSKSVQVSSEADNDSIISTSGILKSYSKRDVLMETPK